MGESKFKGIAALFAGMALSIHAFGEGIESTAGSEQAFISFDQMGWKGSIGAGAGIVPSYEGAGTHRIHFIPLLDAEAGRLFFSTMRGIGMNLSSLHGIRFGPRITYSTGRKQSYDTRLSGMGNVTGTGQIGFFVNARSEPWYTTDDVRSDGHGTRLDFEVGYESKPTGEDRIRAGAKLSWADPRYMQTFFGVDSSQAAFSGLPQYNAGAGIKDYGINVNWRHNYSRKWFSNTGLQARRLSRGVSGSPLVASGLETSASFLLGYRF